jgi:hypothetical protein
LSYGQPLPRKASIVALEVKKQDDKGKANSANAGASATSKSILLPVLRQKNLATEGKKQDGKGKAEIANVIGRSTDGDKQKPLQTTKSKTAGSEAKKPDAKGKAKAADADEDGRVPAKSSRQAATFAPCGCG